MALSTSSRRTCLRMRTYGCYKIPRADTGVSDWCSASHASQLYCKVVIPTKAGIQPRKIGFRVKSEW
jgi:hypothetical protein